MIHIITAVGVLICAVALVGLAAPSSLMPLASAAAGSRPLRIAAITGRIILGAIVIVAAEQTLYPWPMKILGVLFIMAGTLLAMVNRKVLDRWIEAFKSNSGAARAASLAALAVGAFLIHASA